jgi:hypothetical protein
MAKEITTTVNATISPPGGGSAVAKSTLTEDLSGECVGFKFTIGIAAAAISLTGILAPKVVCVKNTDPANFVTLDNTIALTSWPQVLQPGASVLLRPENGTLFGKANTAPCDLWIVAG